MRRKLEQLAAEPPETKTHLVLIGASATVATPTDALSAVVGILTNT